MLDRFEWDEPPEPQVERCWKCKGRGRDPKNPQYYCDECSEEYEIEEEEETLDDED